MKKIKNLIITMAAGTSLFVGLHLQQAQAADGGSSSVSLDTVSIESTSAPDTYDEHAGKTTRVSVSSTGEQGNGGVYNNHSNTDGTSYASISADGRYVAFSSDANNLVAGDTNDATDVFVHDRNTGMTTRVSVSSTGEQVDAGGYSNAISAEGRYVAFFSDADDLVAGDTNNSSDAFVHDRGGLG